MDGQNPSVSEIFKGKVECANGCFTAEWSKMYKDSLSKDLKIIFPV